MSGLARASGFGDVAFVIIIMSKPWSATEALIVSLPKKGDVSDQSIGLHKDCFSF